MMLVVVADVVLRFVFNTPVRGAYDMVSALLLVMVFFGIGPVVAGRREILVDLVGSVLPGGALRALKLAAALATVAVFAFLAWSMVSPAQDAYRYGDRSLELGIRVWTLWAIAFVGLAGIFWAALRMVWQILRGDSPSDDPEADEGGA